eukprot:1046656-Alexandrium_andersonii.AAC.1
MGGAHSRTALKEGHDWSLQCPLTWNNQTQHPSPTPTPHALPSYTTRPPPTPNTHLAKAPPHCERNTCISWDGWRPYRKEI